MTIAARSVRRAVGIRPNRYLLQRLDQKKARKPKVFSGTLTTGACPQPQALTEYPTSTDIDMPVPYLQNKHVLFGLREGRCNGCRSEFPLRVFEVYQVTRLRELGIVA